MSSTLCFLLSFSSLAEFQKKRIGNSNFATGLNLHLPVDLSLYSIPKMGIANFKWPWKKIGSFQGEHLEQVHTSQHVPYFPQGQAPRLPMVD